MASQRSREVAEPRIYAQILLECRAALRAAQLQAALVVGLSAKAAQQDLGLDEALAEVRL